MVKVGKVMLVGLPGSGKTAFMYSLLYDIAQRQDKYDTYVIPVGKFFIDLKSVIEKIREGVPPSKTLPKEINKLSLEVKLNKRTLRIILEDWSGEKISPFIDPDATFDDIRNNRETMEFFNRLLESKVIMIFYDPTKKDVELLKQSRGLNKAMIFLRDHKTGFRIFRRESSKLNVGIAIVVSKCDVKPEIFEDPEEWIRSADFLYNFLKNNFKYVKVFATSAYGESIQIDTEKWIPKSGEFKPKGVREVFQWVKETLSKVI